MATSNKGGYDCEFITAPPKSLECPICLLTVCQPHVISCCGNQFCQACIGRIQQDNKPCPLCNKVNFTTFLHKGVMREVNLLMIYCPNKKDGCDWKGELGQLEEHLNPSVESNTGKECGCVLVECRNKCGEMFLRKAVEDHENERCSKRPVQAQIGLLVNKLESLSSKVNGLITENTMLKTENEIFKKECEEVKVECQRLKTENEEMKKTVDRIQSDCVSLKSCVMPIVPYTLTVENVSLYMDKSKCYRWWSRSYYSSNEGYKMKVCVYPNGFGTGKGTHVSLFVGIRLGEYDDKLKWPFKGQVDIELYNPTSQKWTNLRTIDFNDAPTNHRRKPLKDTPGSGNSPWGYHQVLSHNDLKKFYLISNDDTLRFRVSHVHGEF